MLSNCKEKSIIQLMGCLCEVMVSTLQTRPVTVPGGPSVRPLPHPFAIAFFFFQLFIRCGIPVPFSLTTHSSFPLLEQMT